LSNMFKPRRKRYLSLIFVPDQDKDPKSVSMSYGKGRLLFAVLILLAVHFIMGGVNYFRVAKLTATKRSLLRENAELIERNKRIDQIEKEFNEIQRTDEKIRRAFGVTLGVGEQPNPKAEASKAQSSGKVELAPTVESIPEPTESRPSGVTPLYFLSHKEADFFNPDNLPTLLPVVNGVVTTHFRNGEMFPGRSHWGIDIAAQKGTVIQAAGSGVVLLADWTPDFGNMVIVSHAMGFTSYYGHTMQVLVRQGAKVKKGQIIALVGSSGISSAPHLHFEIWKDGKPINPEDFLYAVQKLKTGTNY
jgi:murein DD-endopeptidase MepM/ murein hydrolase activator NlpD